MVFEQQLLDRLKAALYGVYVGSVAHAKGLYRWRKDEVNRRGLRVYYGHDYIPSPGERASGGIVKCQDLQALYPNNLRGANLVYLVSSALPNCPVILVKYAKRGGAKLVVNQNGVAFPAYHGNRTEVINSPRRRLLEQADYVIYQSHYCKLSADTFLTNGVGKHTILHNPVDTDFFCPAEQARGPRRQPVLLMTGSHGFFYRVVSGVQCLAALHHRNVEARLRIAGRLAWKPNPEVCKQELLAACREYRMEEYVEIGKPYRQVDAPEIYRDADVLIHTQYNDACPRTVVEALACGLPVVYSKSGGTPELVGDQAGKGIQVRLDWNYVSWVDPDRMAENVMEVLEGHRIFSAAARDRARQHFDVNRWLEAHSRIFQELVSG